MLRVSEVRKEGKERKRIRKERGTRVRRKGGIGRGKR